MEKPLIENTFTLQKMEGKGGWTYVVIPQIANVKKGAFGMVKVKGEIDGFVLKNYRLMPMKAGTLFLPVKAEIRKKIKKQEGDSVKIILYADNDPIEIPEEFLTCLMDEPQIHERFLTYSEGEQKMYIDWINNAKRLETKANRIALAMEKISKNLKFMDKVS